MPGLSRWLSLACAPFALSVITLAAVAARPDPAAVPAAPPSAVASAPPAPVASRERDLVATPVPTVQPGRLTIASRAGPFVLPIAVSRDWTRRQAGVTRAVVVIPGWPRRDLRSGEHAAMLAGTAARGTLLVTPQFLTGTDVAAHHLSANTLRWSANGWPRGEPSLDAAGLGSFEVVDQIFRRLADRTVFPNLRTIVLAGHSAGGQLVQRYVAIGQGEAVLGGAPIHVRYVVANPASYLYLSDERPDAEGSFRPFDAASCPDFDDWTYGLRTGMPSYPARLATPEAIRARYLQRDVTYLLGTDDNDPHADGQDLSCAAEAQGATRHARGKAFYAYLHLLDPHTAQRLIEVPGVGHSSYRIYAAPCGMSALFDRPGCGAGG
ncbi:alpha/beta hydrolase [Burkholderia plantarii]|uniref:Putative exported protein n=1 Tax=Burkholderia plantarii TaxID=41899 RepID=A0A0B6S986_BURPL|nr:alpha/beta hydrolase [Burkholderia plantarii]AJK48801.1 putative exported protein [Burkholderia plantarii]